MSNNAARRRTQFTSCDGCRQSRLGCDASKHGYEPGKARWRGSCSRCSRRKRPCTFDWIKCVRNPSSDLRQESSEPSSALDETSSRSDVTDELPAEWLEYIFENGFDAIFGLSVGRFGCPFVNDPTSDVSMQAIDLTSKLDAYLGKESYLQAQGCTASATRIEQDDIEINQSLRCAVRAFTLLWLPLASSRYDMRLDDVNQLITREWRAARKAMLKVINRPSYRSILALILFFQTPAPTGISEEEELDGISGLLCLQTALLQVQQLRGRQENRTVSSPPQAHFTQAFLDLESRAYWAAVVWDTSSAMTLNLRTSLTSGLRGACSEPAWRLTSAFLVGSFQPTAARWLKDGIEITDEVATEIIAAAAVSKLYIWKNIASIKEAIREGLDEDTVLFVWSNVLAALNIYQTSFRALLNACERKLHFLNQINRLNWYQVCLHYHLGILVLVETLEAADRADLLPSIRSARQDTELEALNVLKFGLENTYVLTFGATLSHPPEQTTISLVEIDPNPQRVVDITLFMHRVISRKKRQKQIKDDTFSYLSSMLQNALEKLPQSLKYVQAARNRLRDISVGPSP